jgi:P-type E1-E2 ATPase
VLLGVSAVQDLLQDKVEECISDFYEAGIKVWMLTGDKEETAKQIGYQCDLFKRGDKF